MKKIFIITTIFLVLILLIIIMNFQYLNPYNTELFHPIFGALLPLAFLFFFCIFLKNVNPKYVFLTVFIFGVLSFIILSATDSTCSQIVCYDRSTLALILSSSFSIIYFIILLFQNKKQPDNLN